MEIITYFTRGGVPVTGLSPTLDIWTIAGVQVATSVSMSEVDGGFYRYDYEDYDGTREYCLRADGGSSLSIADRFTYGTNDAGSVKLDTSAIISSLTALKGSSFRDDKDTIRSVSDRLDSVVSGAGGRWRIEGGKMVFYDYNNKKKISEFDLKDELRDVRRDILRHYRK